MRVYPQLPNQQSAPCVIALGLFDGLHLGHMAVINEMLSASGNASRCVFTFSTNHSLPCAKSHSRLMSQNARDHLLEAAGITAIFEPPFEDIRELPPEQFAKEILGQKLNAAHVFCGENFRFGKGASATAYDLQTLLPKDCGICVVPMVNLLGAPVSTTRVCGFIEAGDVKTAAKLLGRAFSIDFPVIPGNRIGRTLNMPTINQAFPAGYCLPRFGVYASVTAVDGIQYKSVTNVGVKPTIGGGVVLSETYIDGYSGDLYGARVPVELLEFIRPEQKFESLDALKTQIRLDLQARLALK